MNAKPFAQRILSHWLRVTIDSCALPNAVLRLCVGFLWMFILAAGALWVAGSARFVRGRKWLAPYPLQGALNTSFTKLK